MKATVYLFMALAMTLALYVESPAQFEGAVWDTLTSDTLMDALSRHPFTSTPGGYHLTYAKSRGQGQGWEVYYRYFDILSGWNDDVLVESGLPAYSPSIAAREFDAFRIAIAFDSGNDIYTAVVYSPWDDWDAVNLTDSPDPDIEPAVAVDGEGKVHLAWITEIEGEYKIAYGTLENGNFDMEILEESDLGMFGSGAQPLIIEVDDLPHIFYRGVNSGFYHIHHAFKESPGGDWSIEFLFTGNVDDYEASAVSDHDFNIHLSVSGNEGWGMPGRVYYAMRDYQTGQWTSFELATGSYSVVEGRIAVYNDGIIYIASAGVSGNFYTGDIYLTDNASGQFETEHLAYYQDGTNPHITLLGGAIGALAMQGIIGEYDSDNLEILFYGPQRVGIFEEIEYPRTAYVISSYPNPFNSNVLIKVEGDLRPGILIDIYDVLGRKIRSLASVEGDASTSYFRWDGIDLEGRQCPGGVYFYSTGEPGTGQTGKLTLIK
jgi:hypothetical protein